MIREPRQGEEAEMWFEGAVQDDERINHKG